MKNFVFVFVCCLLAVSAFAHHKGVSMSGRHPGVDAIANSKEVREAFRGSHPHPGFAHPQMREMRRMRKEMIVDNRQMHKPDTKRFQNSHMVTLVPNQTFVETIQYASLFTVPFEEGDSIAVQIVRSSDLYSFDDDETPTLYRCDLRKKGCVSENLSFEVSADVLKRYRRSGYPFTLTTYSSHVTGVIVGLYVCVGENASLETCIAPAITADCTHGKPSDVMDICICEKGYTGSDCSEQTSDPTWEYDSEMDAAFEVIGCVLSIIFNIVFFTIVGTMVVCCCSLCCSCCRRRSCQNGRVVHNCNNVRAVPPPPPYVRAGAYHPLSVAPPPPPPPMQQNTPYDPYNGKAIEMTTLPASRVANPVFIMPPLAPVNQVPVFVQPPPAPKN